MYLYYTLYTIPQSLNHELLPQCHSSTSNTCLYDTMYYTTKSQEGILASESLMYDKYVFILYYVLYHKLSTTNSCLRVTHVQQIHKHILVCVGSKRLVCTTHTQSHARTCCIHTCCVYVLYTYVLCVQHIHKHRLVCVVFTCCIHVLYISRDYTHTATHCNTLQHTATHCNTLQHTVIHIQRLLTTAPRAMARKSYKERYMCSLLHVCSLFIYMTHQPSNYTCIHLDVLNIFICISIL